MRVYCAVILGCWTLTGCGYSLFAEPKTNPVIEDRIGSPLSSDQYIGTLATTAERRIVLAPLGGEKSGQFCAEPSPDAAESLVASFSAAVDGKLENATGTDAEVKAEIARSIATSVGALTRRSQGLQLFRDGIFALCQFRLNGFIGDEEFVTQYFQLRLAAERVMLAEIEKDNWNAAPNIVINAPSVPANP